MMMILASILAATVAADIPLTGGAVGGLAWLTRARVLALQEVCCSERQRVVVVDLAHRRVQARYDLGGSVLRVAHTSGDLVLLLAPAKAIGTARAPSALRNLMMFSSFSSRPRGPS